MKKVLKIRNFALLFYGNLVSQIGNTLFGFAISWYILELTGSPFQAGIFMATGVVVELVLTPFAGVIADRFSKVKIVYMTDFIRSFVVLIAGIIIFMGVSKTIEMVVLYTTVIILAMNGALFRPAVGGLRAEVVPKEDYQAANATMSITNSLQGVIGIALGGALYGLLGVYGIFIVDGLSFLFSAISELFIRIKEKEVVGKLDWKSGIADLKDGIQYLRRQKGLMSLMFGALFLNFSFTPLFANGMPYLFNQVLEKTPLHYSFVQIAFSAGSLVTAVLIGNLTKQLKVRKSIFGGFVQMLIVFIVFTGLIVLIMQNLIPYWVFLVSTVLVMILFGIIIMYINTPLNTAFMKSIDEEYRGRAFAVIGTLSQGLIPVALMFGGAMIEGFGLIVTSITSSVILMIVLLSMIRSTSIGQYLDGLEEI